MVIPFYKPTTSANPISELLEDLHHGSEPNGAKVRQFEQEFAAYLNHKHAFALKSYADALHLALQAIGLKPGEGVLVPTMSPPTAAEVIRGLDAYLLLADCTADDFNLDLGDAERRLKQAYAKGIVMRAMLPTHFAGQIGDVPGVRRLAQQYQLRIIEDASWCCPGFYREDRQQPWRTVGSSADIACFGFEEHNAIFIGQGAMLCTGENQYGDWLRYFLKPATSPTFNPFAPEESRRSEKEPASEHGLGDVAAAVGLRELRRADKLQMMRTCVAGYYDELLCEVDELTHPRTHPDRIHCWTSYVIRLQTGALSIPRAEVMELLKQAGISTRVHDLPLHMQPTGSALPQVMDDLPCATLVSQEMLALPIYPEMTSEEAEYVVDNLKEIIARHPKNFKLHVLKPGEPDLPPNDLPL